jgi:uncharacterized iron-regulated protein
MLSITTARHRALHRVSLAALVVLAAAPVAAERLESAAALEGRIDGADVVILGEVHDNPEHHAFQDAAIDVVKPSAIVFEMLTPEEAARVTPDLAAQPEALESALAWSESGWPDFSIYYPLLAEAQTLPIYGAEVPRREAQRAFAEGAETVFAGEAARFGLTEALAEAEQAMREAEQQEAHCNALPEDILPGFVEAQRLRDAALAEAVLDALAEHGPSVVVITGNGHARRDWGVPAVLAIAAPDVEVISVGQFEQPPEGEVPYDFWTVADPVDRPDPCAAFQ